MGGGWGWAGRPANVTQGKVSCPCCQRHCRLECNCFGAAVSCLGQRLSRLTPTKEVLVCACRAALHTHFGSSRREQLAGRLSLPFSGCMWQKGVPLDGTGWMGGDFGSVMGWGGGGWGAVGGGRRSGDRSGTDLCGMHRWATAAGPALAKQQHGQVLGGSSGSAGPLTGKRPPPSCFPTAHTAAKEAPESWACTSQERGRQHKAHPLQWPQGSASREAWRALARAALHGSQPGWHRWFACLAACLAGPFAWPGE